MVLEEARQERDRISKLPEDADPVCVETDILNNRKRIWEQVVCPIAVALQAANLDGSYAPRMCTMDVLLDLQQVLARLLRPAPTEAHLTLPMLQSVVSRYVREPHDIMILAAAVWVMGLCDRHAWCAQSTAAGMMLKARFRNDASELMCVPQHYTQVVAPLTFRNRLVRRACDMQWSAVAAKGAFKVVVAGMDALVDAVYGYHAHCCAVEEGRMVFAKDVADKLFQDISPRMNLLTGLGLGGAMPSKSHGTKKADWAWMVVTAYALAWEGAHAGVEYRIPDGFMNWEYVTVPDGPMVPVV